MIGRTDCQRFGCQNMPSGFWYIPAACNCSNTVHQAKSSKHLQPYSYLTSDDNHCLHWIRLLNSIICKLPTAIDLASFWFYTCQTILGSLPDHLPWCIYTLFDVMGSYMSNGQHQGNYLSIRNVNTTLNNFSNILFCSSLSHILSNWRLISPHKTSVPK